MKKPAPHHHTILHSSFEIRNSKFKWRVLAAGLFFLLAAQLFGTRPALFAIDQYREHVSPHLRGIVECRFAPSCSYYGRESIRKHGLLIGGAKTAWRLARCGPWTPLHTPDPP